MIQFQKWYTCDRILITDEANNASVQVDLLKSESLKEHYKADALIWALWVNEANRGYGIGKALLKKAEELIYKRCIYKVAVEWDSRDSKSWVRDWYERKGYEEKEFGVGNALLVKDLRK